MGGVGTVCTLGFIDVTMPVLSNVSPLVGVLQSQILSLMGIVEGRYRYMTDLLALQIPPLTSTLACVRGPSPIFLNRLLPYLARYPDVAFSSYIENGLRHGFRIGFNHESVQLGSSSRNHPSSQEHPGIIADHLREELRQERVVGPIHPSLVNQVHTSPIGLVPKPHSSKWRLIVDLSAPRGHSVNDGISPALCSLTYASVDDAVSIITQLGQGTNLIKVDLSNAYRIVPVHPVDQPLLGITWQGQTYVDRALPFGLRSAPKVFSAVADFLAWVLFCEGVTLVIHYLDDFLIFTPPGSQVPMRQVVESVFQSINVPIACHKTEGPSTSLTFLGIVIDTLKLELSLPLDKVERLLGLLDLWKFKRSCTRKELESLAGHLAHAAIVIRPGRIFLKSLFSLLSRVSNPSHFIRLNVETRADLTWWRCLLHHWNGRSFFPRRTPSCHIYSDASGSYGCGAFHTVSCSWFQLVWPGTWSSASIAAKELLPIIVAAALWGPLWAGEHICFHSDNEAVVTIVNNRCAKDKLLINLLRCLFFYAAVFQFHFSASHIPGVDNHVADAISRNNLSLVSSLFPQASQVFVPGLVVSFLLDLPDWGSRTWMEKFTHSLSRVSPRLQAVAIVQESDATFPSVPDIS